MRNCWISLFVIFWCCTIWTFGQINKEDSPFLEEDPLDSIQSLTFLDMLEFSLIEFYKESKLDEKSDSLFYSFNYTDTDVPAFSDSIYCERILELDKKSPFTFECHPDVLKTVKYFAVNRRKFTSIVLGRSRLYFDMFEEKLAKHDMPLELKYLSVIESGLRPQAKSRAGALGLWQFMYRTGKLYGLEETSFVDERMDPELSTEAACLYLKKLYEMYNDWNLALAAYNAGPGNVNKAIRRSGGKMTYWEIRPYLPRETQAYVPNFIAMAYMLNYYPYHNIQPIEPYFYDFEIDTICIKQSVYMQSLDSVLTWPVEEIKKLNPIYKTAFIPNQESGTCINIPVPLIRDWITYEDSIYKLDSILFYKPNNLASASKSNLTNYTNEGQTHIVRSGETLSAIGKKYGVSVNDLMKWNNLRTTRLRIGQKLVVYSNQPVVASTVSSSVKFHTVGRGDSFWKIASRYGTTVKEIERLNPGVTSNNLKIGQKIKVK